MLEKVEVSLFCAQITVLDTELEIGHDLYSSLLRGIYKGLS